jgi:hypothetical protein
MRETEFRLCNETAGANDRTCWQALLNRVVLTGMFADKKLADRMAY